MIGATRPRQVKNRRPKWILTLILAAALAVTLSSCALDGNEPGLPSENGAPFMLKAQNDKYLREDEWVRMITLAITHGDHRGKIWESIPAGQRAEISQADFFRYIDFLSACLPGTISTYHRASEEESALFRSHTSKVEKQLTPKPADVTFWWIKARTSDLRELKFAIPLTLNESGVPVFSKSWLQRQTALYDFAVLYFDALASGSKPALVSLLRHHLEIRNEAQRTALERRAEDLLAYYRNYVVTGKGTYRCLEMVPGRAVFEELMLALEPAGLRSRTVTFTEADGQMRVDEKISQPLAADDSIIYLRGETLFNEAEGRPVIDSASIIERLGIPLNLEQVHEEGVSATIFRVTWPGLTVEADGTFDTQTLTFRGTIHQLSISYGRFETGSGLKPGDSVHELNARYPFIRENGYLVTRTEEEGTRTLAVQLESDSIARLTLIFDD